MVDTPGVSGAGAAQYQHAGFEYYNTTTKSRIVADNFGPLTPGPYCTLTRVSDTIASPPFPWPYGSVSLLGTMD